MPTVRLNWTDLNPGSIEDGHEVYRSATTFDIGSLPAVLASLGPNVETYDDTGVDPGVYFYAVAAVLDSFRVLSAVVEITVGLDPPSGLSPGGMDPQPPILLNGN